MIEYLIIVLLDTFFFFQGPQCGNALARYFIGWLTADRMTSSLVDVAQIQNEALPFDIESFPFLFYHRANGLPYNACRSSSRSACSLDIGILDRPFAWPDEWTLRRQH